MLNVYIGIDLDVLLHKFSLFTVQTIFNNSNFFFVIIFIFTANLCLASSSNLFTLAIVLLCVYKESDKKKSRAMAV